MRNKIDEVFEALEKTYNHAKMFDNQVYKKGETKYTAPFVNLLKNNSDENYVTKMLPELLINLKEGFCSDKKIKDDPRYTALINKIESEINEGSE